MATGVERYVRDIAATADALFDGHLVGTYVHGSVTLGGFDVRRSDVDVLVVVDGPVSAAQQVAAAEALSEQHLPCPARGLELSIVTLHAARHPTARPAFELHVTTAADDAKVVDGHGHDGDPDLVLHFAVCRAAGRLIGAGQPPQAAFAPVPDGLVRTQLIAELAWSAAAAPGEYSVLNACRAWRFSAAGELTSKVDGGLWAARRESGRNRELIRSALDHQRCLPAPALDPAQVRDFVKDVMRRITGGS